ncbi:MAG: D-alanyl-D-alanine carboxypeptidase [Anaerolineaceae bacterium]|nr:MAG: D-alanyl-D-alanine carboxypeptidase [Anaerolineaceae bacterium]
MKKRYLAILFIIILILGGCQKSSDQFFSYRDYISSAKIDLGIKLSENDFFAEKLVILTDDEYSSADDLVSSEAAFLCDVTHSKALYSKNPYDRLYPASLTKLMTALVVLRRGELTDRVTVSYNASHIPVAGAKVCGFEEGDVITLDSLLHSLLIYSGNDAGIAIAEHMSKSEEAFVKLMNSEAKKIGASHTNFVNSHGLHDDNHYSTAYDMYLIFNELIQYDTFLNIIGQSSYTAVYRDKDNNEKSINLNSTNLYLREEREAPEGIEIVGGKTGVTYRAGNCLVLLSKDSENTQYISIILKADDIDLLYSDMSNLLSFATQGN